ncbi:hypothetical protein GBA52_028886 [Prunus armeniaca]|nr:hypothetical protein GBA52_028886 [Prunus armeniaca]
MASWFGCRLKTSFLPRAFLRKLDVFSLDFDLLLGVWKAAGVCTHILEGHSEPVSSVSIINPEAFTNIFIHFWGKFNAEDTRRNPLKISAFKILRGHRASVQSVAAQTSGNMICSGSWDCTINLWQTNEPVSEKVTLYQQRREKTTGQAKESQSEVMDRSIHLKGMSM